MTFTGIFHTWEFNVHGVMHTTLLHNAFEDASFGGALAVCGHYKLMPFSQMKRPNKHLLQCAPQRKIDYLLWPYNVQQSILLIV